MDKETLKTDLLVIGAGMAGITAALEAAETGYSVALIEKQPFVGGRVARTNKYFPKLCPPQCGLEINFKRLQRNPLVKLFTMAEAEQIDGEPGNFKVTVRRKPRYIKDDCYDPGKAAAALDIERSNDFNLGMDKTKVIYKPYNNAYPQKWVFDKDACADEEIKYVASNFSDCIDLDQKDTIYEIETKAVVVAAGWDPYDPKNLENLGWTEYPEVITNVEMERLASPNGPTAGKIRVPGKDKKLERVAFAQCAGSRDENHLAHCSTICCLASMKQARYVREQYPDAEIHIFYIDLRAHGIFEEFYWETQKDDKIFWHRGKVAKVKKEHGSDQVIVEAEDTMNGALNQLSVDMVVLATGMDPNTKRIPALKKDYLDNNGFLRGDVDGIFGCGVCSRPADVAGSAREATGAALQAIQIIRRAK